MKSTYLGSTLTAIKIATLLKTANSKIVIKVNNLNKQNSIKQKSKKNKKKAQSNQRYKSSYGVGG